MKIVIDKESIIKVFASAFYVVSGEDYNDVKDTVEELLEKIYYEPHEDRPHGSWIDGGDYKICSVCGDKSPIWLTHYCGNCGAKMSDIM